MGIKVLSATCDDYEIFNVTGRIRHVNMQIELGKLYSEHLCQWQSLPPDWVTYTFHRIVEPNCIGPSCTGLYHSDTFTTRIGDDADDEARYATRLTVSNLLCWMHDSFDLVGFRAAIKLIGELDD